MPTANVYIDGFNLYYGSLKKRWPQFKWLDLQSFCESLLLGLQVKRIHYFTARVQNSPRNPRVADRQQAYLRALATLPKLTIHEGLLTVRTVNLPLSNNPTTIVQVIKTEEKRTDVNLATALLLDCCNNDCDEAVVISNDSDLVTPIQAVHQEFGKRVGVISPQLPKQRSRALAQATSWSYRTISRSHFANNQLPAQLIDGNGPITKPATW